MSTEWHQWRGKGIGSSDIASILGISPWKSAHELFLEKTGQVKAVDISNQYQVQRGVINEPKARAMFELIDGKSYPPALHVHPEFNFMRVSLDGENGDTIIEIKCPGQKTMDLAREKKVPDYYMCQIQYQLFVAQKKEAVFFCYQPETEHYEMVTVKPDLELQEKIKLSVIDFWQKVQTKTWNDETDYAEVDFAGLEEKYLTTKANIEKLEIELEQVKEEILKFQDKHKKEIRGKQIKIVKSEVKGLVDYAKIPQLKGINLDEYRKKSTIRVTIKALSDEGAK